MNENDKRTIRKELYANYANDRINGATLAENGLTLLEVIDRDIQILSDHNALLQKNVDFHKSPFVRNFAPFINKLGIIFMGGISSATGIFAVGGFQWCKKIYNGGDVQSRWYNWFVDTAANWDVISYKEYFEEIAQRLKLKEKENPGFLAVGAAVPVAAAFSVVSGLVCMSGIYNAYKYQGNINTHVQKMQKKIKRDQAIIAQLKEIKHNLVI
jgi:hypothetical protein